MLPVDPKLGKMLIMGAIFRCFDPVLTIVAGLSVRDPFLKFLVRVTKRFRKLIGFQFWVSLSCRFEGKD